MTSTTTPATDISADALAALLAKADRRTLAAVVTHLSGDPGAVPDLRDRAAIEQLANELLPAFLDGSRTPEAPSDEVLQAAMSLAAGEAVPAAYAPLVREQMAFGPEVPPAPLPVPEGFKVVIIGGGVTGVLAGILLDRLGLSSFTIVEKNPSPGGTWWQNTYPGCRGRHPEPALLVLLRPGSWLAGALQPPARPAGLHRALRRSRRPRRPPALRRSRSPR